MFKMNLQEVSEEISVHLDCIKEYFIPGAKITLIIRASDDEMGVKDFVMTDDTLLELAKLIERRRIAAEEETDAKQ